MSPKVNHSKFKSSNLNAFSSKFLDQFLIFLRHPFGNPNDHLDQLIPPTLSLKTREAEPFQSHLGMALRPGRNLHPLLPFPASLNFFPVGMPLGILTETSSILPFFR